MSSRPILACFAVACGLTFSGLSPARAHFQELIPTDDIVTAEKGRDVTLDLAFTHPMARGPVMEMAKPLRFGVRSGDRVEDLLGALGARVGEPVGHAPVDT